MKKKFALYFLEKQMIQTSEGTPVANLFITDLIREPEQKEPFDNEDDAIQAMKLALERHPNDRFTVLPFYVKE